MLNVHSTLHVAYWPRPSCQKKKCTCVNNRCIRSKISGDQGRPWLSRGWTECEIVTLAGSRWASNYYITPATGSSDQLEMRCCRENQHPAEGALGTPDWAVEVQSLRWVGEKMLEWGPCPREAEPSGPRLSSPGERERNTVMAIRVGVNMLQFCSVSNSPLTQ